MLEQLNKQIEVNRLEEQVAELADTLRKYLADYNVDPSGREVEECILLNNSLTLIFSGDLYANYDLVYEGDSVLIEQCDLSIKRAMSFGLLNGASSTLNAYVQLLGEFEGYSEQQAIERRLLECAKQLDKDRVKELLGFN